MASVWPGIVLLPSGALPPDQGAADAAAALDALLRAVASGEIAPGEAKPVADLVERTRRLAEAAREEEAAPAAETAPAAAPAPLPAAPASVFSSVLPAPASRRREALLGGASPLPPNVLDSVRPRAGKEGVRKAA